MPSPLRDAPPPPPPGAVSAWAAPPPVIPVPSPWKARERRGEMRSGMEERGSRWKVRKSPVGPIIKQDVLWSKWLLHFLGVGSRWQVRRSKFACRIVNGLICAQLFGHFLWCYEFVIVTSEFVLVYLGIFANGFFFISFPSPLPLPKKKKSLYLVVSLISSHVKVFFTNGHRKPSCMWRMDLACRRRRHQWKLFFSVTGFF